MVNQPMALTPVAKSPPKPNLTRGGISRMPIMPPTVMACHQP